LVIITMTPSVVFVVLPVYPETKANWFHAEAVTPLNATVDVLAVTIRTCAVEPLVHALVDG